MKLKGQRTRSESLDNSNVNPFYNKNNVNKRFHGKMMPEDISKSFVRPASANQSDHVVKDLSKLSKAQLMEMRDRQQDILRNK